MTANTILILVFVGFFIASIVTMFLPVSAVNKIAALFILWFVGFVSVLVYSQFGSQIASTVSRIYG